MTLDTVVTSELPAIVYTTLPKDESKITTYYGRPIIVIPTIGRSWRPLTSNKYFGSWTDVECTKTDATKPRHATISATDLIALTSNYFDEHDDLTIAIPWGDRALNWNLIEIQQILVRNGYRSYRRFLDDLRTLEARIKASFIEGRYQVNGMEIILEFSYFDDEVDADHITTHPIYRHDNCVLENATNNGHGIVRHIGQHEHYQCNRCFGIYKQSEILHRVKVNLLTGDVL